LTTESRICYCSSKQFDVAYANPTFALKGEGLA
jgi:hypothetical protein